MAETMRAMAARALWAERIRGAYGRTVEAVFQVGRELFQAKQELPHGEFMVMVERELPSSVSTAGRYMAIASADHLQIPHIVRNLPSSWGTLDVLQRLDPPTFEAALDRTVAELGDRLQPSPETRAAEAVAGEVLTRLRRVHALLQTASPKPQFNHRWAEAMRLAQAIVKQLEGLS